jgi:heme oxygenase
MPLAARPAAPSAPHPPQTGGAPLLSAQIKQATAAAHRDLEHLMDLPSRLRSRAAYIACLQQFAETLAPIEAALVSFNEWESFGIDIHHRMRLPALHADLADLGAPLPPHAGRARKIFASFAQALGGLYVTEGATLGGQFIAKAITAALGPQTAGKIAFFHGHGPQNGPMWNRLRAAIDAYGETHPLHRQAVTDGALKTFAHFAAGIAIPS